MKCSIPWNWEEFLFLTIRLLFRWSHGFCIAFINCRLGESFFMPKKWQRLGPKNGSWEIRLDIHTSWETLIGGLLVLYKFIVNDSYSISNSSLSSHLGINAFFHVLHLIQSQVQYDALAQDVAISTSQASVIMYSFFITFRLKHSKEWDERGSYRASNFSDFYWIGFWFWFSCLSGAIVVLHLDILSVRLVIVGRKSVHWRRIQLTLFVFIMGTILQCIVLAPSPI